MVTSRYFILISFKGSAYHGWQVQPGSVTIQKVLDHALSTILNERITTTGAGRTDTGVHASTFYAHFDTSDPDLAIKKNIIFRLNRFLPRDIAIINLFRVQPDAHARFSAISRTYQYHINRIKDPFRNDYSWHINGDIDIYSMNSACRLLLGSSDFTSFCRLHSDNKTNICNIFFAEWEESDNRLLFTIKADRFLRNMVRAITGTMVEIGRGKMDLIEFEEIILARDRCRAGKSAPAQGLFLTGIEYPVSVFL